MKQPAVSRAKAFLHEQIQSGAFLETRMLPGAQRLSKQAGVSLVSMWKAMKLLCAEGVIENAAGGRYYLKNGGVNAESAGRAGQLKRESAFLRIYHDILEGKFAPANRLPTLKELSSLYGVSYPTIRHALAKLESIGLISVSARGYTIASGAQGAASLRLLLIGPSSTWGPQIWGVLNEELVREVERICGSRNIELAIGVYRNIKKQTELVYQGTNKKIPLRKNDASLAGALLIANDINEDWQLPFQQLAALGKPVAVLDAIGIKPSQTGGRSKSHARFFSFADYNYAARTMIHFLLRRGHKHYAYISPFHGAVWSKERLRTLQTAISQTGQAAHIAAFTIDHMHILQFLNDAMARCDDTALAKHKDGLNKLLPADYHGHIQQRLNELGGETIAHCEMYSQLQVQFEHALADDKIGAWVCATDAVAAAAQEFLRGRHIKVPQQIALVSFDDSRDALHNNVTSYNFNLHGLAHHIVNYLLLPPGTRAYKRSDKKISARGFISVRRSA